MNLIIIGAGKYGREIQDVAEQTGRFEKISFLDDHAAGEDILGVCADFPKFQNENTAFYVAFGNNDFREKWCEALKASGAVLTNIVHPRAYISPKAKLGVGIAVLPLAIINTYTEIKDGCMINSGAIVDHDCIVEPYTHVCVGSVVKADNHLPSKMKVEAGVVIERETYR